MKKFQKNLIVCAVSIALVAGCCTVLPTEAAYVDRDCSVVALGDDVLCPTDANHSAAEMVADYLGGTAVNCAKQGETSEDLIKDLQSDSTVKSAVQKADVVLVSIGTNDIVNPILYDNDVINAKNYANMEKMAASITTDNVTDLLEVMNDTYPALIQETNDNIDTAIDLIRSMNASCEIVMQDVNNPMGVDYKSLNVSTNRQSAIYNLYKYLGVCLKGGKLPPNEKITISEGINQHIQTLEDVYVSDFYTPFVGASGEKCIGFYLTNVYTFDMRYTEIGQVCLAASMIECCDHLQADGNGTAIADAYTTSGESENLPTLRASLDTVIQAAESHTAITYKKGDLNADGSVSINDAYEALSEYAKLAAGGKTDFVPNKRVAADLDGDSKISITDASMILQYYSACAAGETRSMQEYFA